jgi:hypothetical protein
VTVFVCLVCEDVYVLTVCLPPHGLVYCMTDMSLLPPSSSLSPPPPLSADTTALKNTVLTPVMLKQRKKLYSAVTSSSKKRCLSFRGFIQVLLLLKAQEKGFRSKYSELISIMRALSEYKPCRAYFLQALDKYLVCTTCNIM